MCEENKTQEVLFIDVHDLIRQGRAEDEKLAAQVVIEDGWIRFPEGRYDIELSRINSYQKLISWVVHFLDTKDWITPQMLFRFIQLVANYHGLNVYQTG